MTMLRFFTSPACWSTGKSGLVSQNFYKSNYLVDREVWSALVKFLQVQLPGRPGSLVYTCGIFTSPTTWSTGKSPSERSLLSLLLAAWPAGAGEVGAAHFFWSFLKLSLRLTALGSRPDLAGRPGVLAGGRLQPVRPERPVDDMTGLVVIDELLALSMVSGRPACTHRPRWSAGA